MRVPDNATTGIAKIKVSIPGFDTMKSGLEFAEQTFEMPVEE